MKINNKEENKMKTINPYLSFNGNCEEVFNFYKSVFEVDFLTLQRFKDMPKNSDYDEMYLSENEKEKIMYVALPLGKETILMACDLPEAKGKTNFGNNISISIQAESLEEATKLFNSISSDGKIYMSLGKAFWNAYFGMCTDKFGINWIVNYNYK